jgi:phage-related protein
MTIEVDYMEDARQFLLSLPEKDRLKVLYNIDMVKAGSRDKRIFKKLVGTNIWEFITAYNGMAYRLLSFWDTEEETLVVATHGFSKKTQKTPQKEIDKAETLRIKYFKNKRR